MSLEPQQQDEEVEPGAKHKVKVTKVVDGHEIEEWIELDADSGPGWPARSELVLLNTDIPRVDGPDKVTGRARYTHDQRLKEMLYARLLLCPVAKARVRVNTEKARSIAGVRWAQAWGEAVTSYMGQPIAVVAADTPELAEDALRAIDVEIEELPWAVSPEQALADGAPRVSEAGNVRTDQTRGDEQECEAALGGCDAVVEATYTVPVQHHACLETHGVVADLRSDGEATVYASSQFACGVAEDARRELDVPASQVNAVVEHMGGGFGSKFGLGVEGKLACTLAKELRRPVHLMLSRRDEFLIAGNRSGAVQELKGGATRDGVFRALRSRITKYGGLGRGSHPGQPYIYGVESAYTEIRSVFTHTDSSRAMRAPGHPQASFAVESMVDELAYGIGMDPLEFRKRNLKDASGGPHPVYARQLDAAAGAIGWAEHSHKNAPDPSTGDLKVGIGFAVSTWGGGGSKVCQVQVRVERDGTLRVLSGSQDLGTGTRTYAAAIVAEAFGVDFGAVRAQIGHSDYGPANGSGGSTTTASLAPAVQDAASRARREFLAHLATVFGVDEESIELEKGVIRVRGPESRRVPWSEACAALPVGGVSAAGTWHAHLAARGIHGAQAAKVQVDTLTGEVKVLKMVCVQDCGLALNRLAVRSQILGGMVQSLSYGLFEERVLDADLGVMLNATFTDYKIAGCKDIPEMVAILDDADDRAVIGMAEAPVIPGQSAIANAVYNACGVRVRRLPITADKVLMGSLELKKA